MRPSPVFVLALLLPFSASSAAVITVDRLGVSDFTEIQPAIDFAAAGDTVVVLPGEYVITEPITFLGKAITVKGEKGAAETTIRMSVPQDPDRGSVVIFESGEKNDSVLEGFTLTGAAGSVVPDRLTDGSEFLSRPGGGAVVCVGAAPILRNCVISENAPPFGGQLFGGGVYCGGGARPTIVNCTISRNVASLAGGGVFCGPRSAPTIIDSTISHNVSSDRSAGGVHGWSDTNVRIEGCTISGNVGGGGGVFIGSPSVGTIANCEISGNVASGRGGGVLVFGGTTITGCRIWGNVAEVGGGVCTVFPVTNCVIWGNRAVIGGGIYLGAGLRGHGPITNCTIMGNFADFGGGVASKDTSSPRIFNSIVWGDWGGSATDRESGNDILLGVTNSCIELSQPMALPEGTIAEDPRFRGDGIFDFDRVVTVIVGGLTHNVPDFVVEAPDLRLRAESPCVGTGTLEGAPETDIEGTARPCGAGVGVDMGAFESCSPLHAPFLRGDGNNDGEVGGSTTEAIVLLRFAFLAGDRPPCLAACDADADGTDAVRILRSAFLAQQPPEPPFPECGVSDLPSDISLGCEISPASCR